MNQMKTDLEGAIKWLTDYHSDVEQKFLDGIKKLPSWGLDIDSQVQIYLNRIANWPRGNYCWSFEGKRYFGDRGLEYQGTRVVPLLPKVRPISSETYNQCENVTVYLIEEICGE